MKKLLALILSLVMVMAFFAGCADGSKDKDRDTETTITKDDLVGNWTIEGDIETLMQFASSQEDASELGEMLDLVKEMDLGSMTIGVEFTSDGVVKFDQQSLIDSTKTLVESMVEWLKKEENFYKFFASVQGITEEEAKNTVAQLGISFDEFIAMMDDSFDEMLETIPESMEAEDTLQDNYYSVKDGVIYMWAEGESEEDADSYKVKYDGSVITVISATKDGNTADFKEGALVFKK